MRKIDTMFQDRMMRLQVAAGQRAQYEKSTATIAAVLSVVGAEGVEPPTLCL